MLKLIFPMIALLAPILRSCSIEPFIPLELDRDLARIRLASTTDQTTVMEIWLNGENILATGFLYHEKDRSVVIGTWNEVDLVTSFSMDSTGIMVSPVLINTADERRDVRRLSFKSDGGSGRTETTDGWNWLATGQPPFRTWSLDLSSSVLVLLPEETVTLPGIVLAGPAIPEEYLP